MSTCKSRLSDEQLEKLRQGLRALSEEAISKMFESGPDGKDPFGATFDQREQAAAEIGKAMQAFLVESQCEFDPNLEQMAASAQWECPCCGDLCGREKDKQGNLVREDVKLKTRAGPVCLKAPLFRCKRCRKNFSPLPAVAGSWS